MRSVREPSRPKRWCHKPEAPGGCRLRRPATRSGHWRTKVCPTMRWLSPWLRMQWQMQRSLQRRWPYSRPPRRRRGDGGGDAAGPGQRRPPGSRLPIAHSGRCRAGRTATARAASEGRLPPAVRDWLRWPSRLRLRRRRWKWCRPVPGPASPGRPRPAAGTGWRAPQSMRLIRRQSRLTPPCWKAAGDRRSNSRRHLVEAGKAASRCWMQCSQSTRYYLLFVVGHGTVACTTMQAGCRRQTRLHWSGLRRRARQPMPNGALAWANAAGWRCKSPWIKRHWRQRTTLSAALFPSYSLPASYNKGSERHRLPLPPNRTGGSPASGSPVGGITFKRTGEPHHKRPAS